MSDRVVDPESWQPDGPAGKMPRMPRDRKTKYQGVFARHQLHCRTETNPSARCNCKPSYYGKAYDRAVQKPVRTKRLPTAEIAAAARRDLLAELDAGVAPVALRGERLEETRARFIKAAREGRALNKNGERYKPKAIDNIEQALIKHVEPRLGKRRLGDVRRGDIQAIVGDLAPRLSGSRVRNVVNSVRALYKWANDHDLVEHNPGYNVQLPALKTKPAERIVTPPEFAQLLSVLELEDQAIYALAGYAWARLAQIQRLRWRDVNFADGTVELGIEWLARKYEASHRTVPMLAPLKRILREWQLASGRLSSGDDLVFKPRQDRKVAASGVFSPAAPAARAARAWELAGLERITLKDARHSGATWLDAAGVSPRIASYLMGHKTPKLQQGAAPVTLRTYTHVLEDDIDRAVRHLVAYFAEHQQRAEGAR